MNVDDTYIREHATAASFERGYDYYRLNQVTGLEQRGTTLFAQVVGSDYEPYRITIGLAAEGVASQYCTCPYSYGGWCKHVVAVLLTYLKKPERISHKQSLEEQLGHLSSEKLYDLLETIIALHPEVLETVDEHLA